MKLMKQLLALTFSLFAVLNASSAIAQCSNSIQPSCGVYATCFAKYCPCAAGDEYFVTYGKKYCEKFLGIGTFSESGQKWRNKTLLCLQEAIVPKLDISNKPTCDCKSMRQYAFDSHVKCYLADPSICSLSTGDMLKILNAVGLGSTITDKDSRKQFKLVLSKCLTVFAGDVLKALETTVTALTD
uniref:Uncharacterized protein n=1 Tax=Rhodopseudomonas palustris (strain BisA53) TaxID=316055 RepID=Q07JF2_RHOP5